MMTCGVVSWQTLGPIFIVVKIAVIPDAVEIIADAVTDEADDC